MATIPGCKWIRQNTATINAAFSSARHMNASLTLYKFITWESFDFDAKPEERLHKKDHFLRVQKVSYGNELLNASTYAQLKNRRYVLRGKISFILTTRTRLIVNHGGESVLDNSIALHPYYGFPVIPATAIKGVSRHFCEAALDLHKREKTFI